MRYGVIEKKAREYLGLSLEQVAAILKVDYRYIYALEQGWLTMTKKDICAFERLYGISFEEEDKWADVTIEGLGEKDSKAVVDLMRWKDEMDNYYWNDYNGCWGCGFGEKNKG